MQMTPRSDLVCAACRRPFTSPNDGDNPAGECHACWLVTYAKDLEKATRILRETLDLVWREKWNRGKPYGKEPF